MFRNGLMVALLAYCPIRLKNFAALDTLYALIPDAWTVEPTRPARAAGARGSRRARCRPGALPRSRSASTRPGRRRRTPSCRPPPGRGSRRRPCSWRSRRPRRGKHLPFGLLILGFTFPKTFDACLITLAGIRSLTTNFLEFAGTAKPFELSASSQFECPTLLWNDLVGTFPTSVRQVAIGMVASTVASGLNVTADNILLFYGGGREIGKVSPIHPWRVVRLGVRKRRPRTESARRRSTHV
jgi:hypothetical protein